MLQARAKALQCTILSVSFKLSFAAFLYSAGAPSSSRSRPSAALGPPACDRLQIGEEASLSYLSPQPFSPVRPSCLGGICRGCLLAGRRILVLDSRFVPVGVSGLNLC